MDLTAAVIVGLIALLLAGCQIAADQPAAPSPAPPMARIVPEKLVKHGHERIDDYYWLKERNDPAVIAYLEAENEYTRAVMAHTKPLRKRLFEEIKGRIKQNDASVPFKKGDYFYYSRKEEGRDYAIHCRKKGSLDAAEEIMLDANALAEGHDYFSVRGLSPRALAVSSNQQILAYAVDTVGRRIYTIHFKNLATGEIAADKIQAVTGNMAWANDNETLFYARQDPTTLRSCKIFSHKLGTDPGTDRLVFEEKDEEFAARVFKTRSGRFLMIASRQTLSAEYRFLDAGDPDGDFEVFLAREREHEYSIDHYEDSFYIRTNWEAQNFRLMKTPLARGGKENWREVVPHREEVLLGRFTLFEDHLVLSERKEGLNRIRVIPWADLVDTGVVEDADRNAVEDAGHVIDFGEALYAAYVSTNPEFDTHVLRYVYSSPRTPLSTFDYDMVSRAKVLLKQDEVLGGFDAEDYGTERVRVVARDGAIVPVSILFPKGMKRDGSHPLYLYGYGSYGASMDASFESSMLSLVDRGFVYAIAHVRGGQEKGRQWYEDGKLLKKKNTFTDFVDCAEFLVREGYTSRDRLFASGGSAGGLLVGAVINMRPDLFKGVVADVPFVDVVTTMLDETIPLTTSEYDEWGNPNEKVYYDYMLSYSPYDNVAAQDYPHLLVTAGLHDSQVQYFEPAKWVARLRARRTDGNRLLLKTNMEAGHGGASGRTRQYEETAFAFGFILDLLNEPSAE